MWQKIKDGFRNFMTGRHGGDQLSLALLIGGIVLSLLSSITRIMIFYYLGLAAYIWALFRMFSRNNAKRTALNFIEVLEQDIKGHLELLEKLKKEDLTLEEPPKAEPVRQKPFDFEADDEKPLVVPKAAPAAKSETTEEIANEIEQNLNRLMDLDQSSDAEPAEPARHATDNTIKFTNLQFGRNYDPTSH